jgi:hypothetical protein
MRILKHIRFCFLLLTVCLAVEPVLAQNYKQDIRNINQNYNKDKWKIKTLYKAYSVGSAVPFENQEGVSIKYGKDYYSRLGDLENLVLAQGPCLYINHLQKSVSYFKKPIGSSATNLSMDKMIAHYDTVYEKKTFTDLGKNVAQYTLQSTTVAEYSKVVLVFDKHTFWLQKVELWYRPGMKVDSENGSVECSKLVISLLQMPLANQKPKEMLIDRYVVCRDNKCKGIEPLDTYRFILN